MDPWVPGRKESRLRFPAILSRAGSPVGLTGVTPGSKRSWPPVNRLTKTSENVWLSSQRKRRSYDQRGKGRGPGQIKPTHAHGWQMFSDEGKVA